MYKMTTLWSPQHERTIVWNDSDIGVRWRSDYIRGVGHRDAKFVILFDLPRLFSTDSVLIAKAPQQAVA